MIRNYLKIAWRSLLRRRMFTLINIVGLAVGISFSLLIGVYILQEKQVNAGLNNLEGQYFVKSDWKVREMGIDITTVGPLPKTVKEEYPELVADYYRFNPVTNVVSAGDKHFQENIAICDTTLISMYGFPLLYGQKDNAFPNEQSAVITETLAMKLFGRKNAVNQRLSVATTTGEQQDYLVSAVLRDLPRNTVTGLLGETYSIFVPTSGNRYYPGGDPAASWATVFEVGFIRLQPGVSPAQLEEPFRHLLKKYTAENIQENLRVELVPVKDYYLNDNNGAARKVVITLSLVALFILSMAIINFININVGTSTYRLREIGLRKVFGGERKQLVAQYLVEAMLLTALSGLLAVTFYDLLRPFFDQLLQSSLQPVWQFGWRQWILLLSLLLGVGLLAGIYPALVLSGIAIGQAVKGKISSSKGALVLKKSLLVLQFSLAILVFIGGLVVSRQVEYIFNKDLGYDKEQVLVATAFPKQWDSTGVERMIGLRQGLRQLSSVKDVSLTFEIPERKPPGSIDLRAEGMDHPLLIAASNVDENYAKVFGIRLLSGTFFGDKGGGHLPGQIVLNEAAAKAFGFTPEKAIGKTMAMANGDVFTVKGVVNNYNYSSFSQLIEPMAFVHVEDGLTYRYIAIKVAGSNINTAIASVRARWKEILPNAPFEYFFMDEKFRSLYAAELRLKKATGLATLLNLFIVLMGIFGVVSFMMVRRRKEIAIRKVLGAEVGNIILLFVREYAALIFIANLISWPLAYWFTYQWLQQYAYRIQQDLQPFLIAGLSIFLLAVFLIGILSLRSALRSPVKNLRTE